jgi:hypothetical protein
VRLGRLQDQLLRLGRDRAQGDAKHVCDPLRRQGAAEPEDEHAAGVDEVRAALHHVRRAEGHRLRELDVLALQGGAFKVWLGG